MRKPKERERIGLTDITKEDALKRLKGVISEEEYLRIQKYGLSEIIAVYRREFEGQEKRLRVLGSVPIEGEFYVMRLYLDNGKSIILISPFDFTTTMSFYKGKVYTKWGMVDGVKTDLYLKLLDIVPDVKTGKLTGIYLVMMSPSFSDHDINVVDLDKKIDALKVMEKKLEIMKADAMKYKQAAEELDRLLVAVREAHKEDAERIQEIAEDYATPIIITVLSAMGSVQELMEKARKDFLRESLKWTDIVRYILLFGVSAIGLYMLYLLMTGR